MCPGSWSQRVPAVASCGCTACCCDPPHPTVLFNTTYNPLTHPACLARTLSVRGQETSSAIHSGWVCVENNDTGIAMNMVAARNGRPHSTRQFQPVLAQASAAHPSRYTEVQAVNVMYCTATHPPPGSTVAMSDSVSLPARPHTARGVGYSVHAHCAMR